MRPLVLISSLATGGAERVTVSFVRHLAAHRRPVPLCTVTGREDGPLAAEAAGAGIVRYDLGARRLIDPLALIRLLRLLRSEGIDLVHAHGQDASILGALARRLVPIGLVITRHVLEEPDSTWRLRARARLALAAMRDADAVVAVSDAVADRLAGLARMPKEGVHVIRNGIELARFSNSDLSRSAGAVRHALGLTRAMPLIVVPAALREGKGHDVLLAAWGAVRADVPRARLAIVGSGEREAALQALARPHGDTVSFLGLRQDIPELLAASDLVVLPSLAEALPTALIEAAAAGRAVVATRVGGVEEVVEDGRTGILVPPGDPDALARAMVRLLVDPERAGAFGSAARASARERFSIEAQVRRTIELWDRVVAARSRVAPAIHHASE